MKIRTVLYPTDFSRCAGQALAHALFLSQRFGADLHMLHAILLHEYDPANPENRFPAVDEALRQLDEAAVGQLTKLAESRPGKEQKVVHSTVRGFSAAEVILDYAAEHDVDLIVMGTHGRRGPARFFLGSVASEVVRTAQCPVLTLREQEEPREVEKIERLLVPIDFSDDSAAGLADARDLAEAYEARLVLLHVVQEPPRPYFYAPVGGLSVAEHLDEVREKAREALRSLAAEAGLENVEVEVAAGPPAAEIARAAEAADCDMIVIPAHGLSGVERVLMSTTAEQVARLAHCPVLSVKPRPAAG